MKVRNAGSNLINLRKVVVDANNHKRDVLLAPGESIILFDEIVEQDHQMAELLDSGVLVKVDDSEPSDGSKAADPMEKILSWIISQGMLVQFSPPNGGDPNPYSGPKEGTTVSICITDGHGILNTFVSGPTVDVTVTGGSSANPKLNGEDSPQTITFTNGIATVAVSADDAGTVDLALADPSDDLQLVLGDTAEVTLS